MKLSDKHPDVIFAFYIGIILSVSCLFYLLYYFDWNAGLGRGLTLLALILLLVLKNNYFNIEFSIPKATTFLTVLFLSLFAWNTWFFIVNLESYPIDVGESSLISIELFWRWFKNPYTHTVDIVEISHPYLFFEGYKYFPLTFIIYTPSVLLLKVKGLYITNFIFHIITAIYIFKITMLFEKDSKIDRPLISVILYLSSYLVLFELFRQGVNDIIPAFFILASFYYYLDQKEIKSALFLGASLASKWLPGTLFFFLIFPQVKNKKNFLYCCGGIFLLTVLPFIAWDFLSFVGNTFIYFYLKPGDSTGFMDGTNTLLAEIIIFAIIGLFSLTFVFYFRNHNYNSSLILSYYIVLLALFFLILKENHRNHLIWIIPFYSISISLNAVRKDSTGKSKFIDLLKPSVFFKKILKKHK
ncbi:MAG TPA: hypothetical protein QF468_08915 [Nitrospinota bacterium]|nr:hypothetical protein [Nitrospinota bacterium]